MARGSQWNKGSLHGCTGAWQVLVQHSAREGDGWSMQVADEDVVSMKPGNAGGEKVL